MEVAGIPEIKSLFDDARRCGKLTQALEAVRTLRRLEPERARWAQQEGELLRRLERPNEAVEALRSAALRYAHQGFVARAVAMAKMILTIDPMRRDVLEAVDPSVARALYRQSFPDLRREVGERSSFVDGAVSLRKASDEAEDEVRFVDLSPDEVTELDPGELEFLDEEPEPWTEAPISRVALMPGFPLFSELPQDRLHMLAEASDLVSLMDESLVIRRGERADALYCIVEGCVRIQVPGLEPADQPRLGEGDIFGEACLLGGGRRQADVSVEGALVALRIPKNVLYASIAGQAGLADLLTELLARRLVANYVRTSPLFTAFDNVHRRSLIKCFELRTAAAQTVLLQEGKRSDGLYILLMGQAGAGRSRLAQVPLGPGAIFGQHSLLGLGLAKATIMTSTECLLLRLPSQRFSEVASSYPPALDHLSQMSGRPSAAFVDAIPRGSFSA